MYYSLDDLKALGISYPLRDIIADYTLDGVRFGSVKQVGRHSSPNETRLVKRDYYEPYAVAHALAALGCRRVPMFAKDKPDVHAFVDGEMIGIEQVDVIDPELADAVHSGLDIERNVRDEINADPNLAKSLSGHLVTVSFQLPPKGRTKDITAELVDKIRRGHFEAAGSPALERHGATFHVTPVANDSNFSIMYGTGSKGLTTPPQQILQARLEEKIRKSGNYLIRPLWLVMTPLEATLIEARDVDDAIAGAGGIKPFDRLVVCSDLNGIIDRK